MIWYVALIAILNLALGYALATFLGGRPQFAVASGEPMELFDDDEEDDDEQWDS